MATALIDSYVQLEKIAAERKLTRDARLEAALYDLAAPLRAIEKERGGLKLVTDKKEAQAILDGVVGRGPIVSTPSLLVVISSNETQVGHTPLLAPLLSPLGCVHSLSLKYGDIAIIVGGICMVLRERKRIDDALSNVKHLQIQLAELSALKMPVSSCGILLEGSVTVVESSRLLHELEHEALFRYQISWQTTRDLYDTCVFVAYDVLASLRMRAAQRNSPVSMPLDEKTRIDACEILKAKTAQKRKRGAKTLALPLEKMLSANEGVSSLVAVALTNQFKTMKSLVEHLSQFSNDKERIRSLHQLPMIVRSKATTVSKGAASAVVSVLFEDLNAKQEVMAKE